MASCGKSSLVDSQSPSISFVEIPSAGKGDGGRLSVITGGVVGAQPGQRIVLYARSGAAWYVQPFIDQPFTTIQSDSTWRNSTHPGEEYAALLVGPEFHAVPKSQGVPTEGVLATAIAVGIPPIWKRWWFFAIEGLAVLAAAIALHRLRMQQAAARLNLRFEDRLAERTRVAQILHDTLLQGVISSSMQLHVAIQQLPQESPALESLNHVLLSMGQVVEEGRNTLRGMKLASNSRDLAQSIARLGDDLNLAIEVKAKGVSVPLQPEIRASLLNIATEILTALANDPCATHADVELRNTAAEFLLRIRHNGAPLPIEFVRKNVEAIGGAIQVRRAAREQSDIELRLPSHLAFESVPIRRASGWFRRVKNAG